LGLFLNYRREVAREVAGPSHSVDLLLDIPDIPQPRFREASKDQAASGTPKQPEPSSAMKMHPEVTETMSQGNCNWLQPASIWS